MAALTQDKNTDSREGDIRNLPVAASTKIFAGSIVAINATGYAVPASDTANLKVVGRAEQYIDNSAGANAAKTINVRKGCFKYAATGLTLAVVGATLYIVDDQTVKTATGTNSIVAGTGFEYISPTEVWITI